MASKPCAACLTIPAVKASGYETKGTYTEYAGLKTYVTGPAEAKKAILFVYDIFGYCDQTLQGADILAYSNTESPYRVYVPDWFEGQPAQRAWHPPKTDEDKAKSAAFWSRIGPPTQTVERVPGVVKAVQEKDSPTAWGALGLCWGGKVIALSSGPDTPFDAAAMAHPAFVNAADAAKITIPFAVLASKDESAEAVAEFEKALKTPKHVETYSDQIHGWMGARSDLSDERNVEEFTRGYKTVLEFFREHV
ncbi:MAG: hypothetical protein M1838_004640 [Thelocarpon superellum]|nr:MAG: hypothetical protein M1838_004640 [Thelocarpon superellum]